MNHILKRISTDTSIFIVLCIYLLLFNVESGAEVGLTGQKGLVRSFSAQTLQRGKMVINFAGEYSTAPGYLLYQVAEDGSRTTGNELMTSGYFSMSFGLTDYIDFSGMLPLYADILSGSDVLPKKEDGGIGDISLGLKLQYPPYKHNHFFDMSYLGTVSLPTGFKEKGLFARHTYYIPKNPSAEQLSLYTSSNMEVDLKMLWTMDFGAIEWDNQDLSQLKLHLNYGVRFTANTLLDHVFLLNSAIEYSPVTFLTLFTEFTGETRLKNVDKGFRIGDDPLRITPGFSLNTPQGLVIKIAVDKSLTGGVEQEFNQSGRVYGTKIIPDWNVFASLEWGGFLISKDKDKDKIKDDIDKCPNEPEDIDGFEDSDGCPDLDNDKDGVPDIKDRCPNQSEDIDGFEDDDGCIDADNDKDGIPDNRDKCPNKPEDMDGIDDADGCPDLDNDKDGVPDTKDRCPNQSEDMDGFEDDDGCPDLDNDKDGIIDTKDKCPNKPENINQFEDNDGCPDAKPKVKAIKKGRMVLKGVNFKSGSSELTYTSYAILDKVAESLLGYPKVRVEIRGYTDNIGKRSSNTRLSKRRAEAVKRYLVNRGIKSGRLVAIGMGPSSPIASNRTARGRAKNRRIEFYRLN